MRKVLTEACASCGGGVRLWQPARTPQALRNGMVDGIEGDQLDEVAEGAEAVAGAAGNHHPVACDGLEFTAS